MRPGYFEGIDSERGFAWRVESKPLYQLIPAGGMIECGNFQQYLLGSAFEILAREGSGHLKELSSGRGGRLFTRVSVACFGAGG